VLRNTPKLTFKHDNSAQRGVNLVNLLDDIEQNLPKAPPLPEGEFDPEI
jgi:ribosome-binding factor A